MDLTLLAVSSPTTLSIMKNKTPKKILTAFFVFLFWISVWWIFASFVNNSYLLPSPSDTFSALAELFSYGYFYKVIFLSLLRVLLGLVLGIVFGTALAFICHGFSLLRSLVTPLVSVIKAMPVATFILLLWLTLRGSSLTIFIGFIMVMPIIFQNVLSGLDSIDKDLIEVSWVFEFSPSKRLSLLVFPALRSYLAPAIITSVGLAFKSQIAAEIIAYTKNSIGQYIYDANYGLDTPAVFAWAAVIVTFSIGLETICRHLLGRVKK